MGTQSLQEITAKTTGKDWNRVHDQIVREHELRVAAGLEQKESSIMDPSIMETIEEEDKKDKGKEKE
jgi:hypothetical protein